MNSQYAEKVYLANAVLTKPDEKDKESSEEEQLSHGSALHPIGKDNSDQCSLAQNDEASRKSDVEKDGDSMKSSVVSSLSCSSSAVKILPQENSCGPQQLPASAENGCSGMFQKIHGGSGSHVKKARDMFEQSSASAKPPTPPKPDFVQKPRYDTNLMKNLLSERF